LKTQREEKKSWGQITDRERGRSKALREDAAMIVKDSRGHLKVKRPKLKVPEKLPGPAEKNRHPNC